MKAYQSGLARFENAGAQVLGISVNSIDRNRAFSEKLGLSFPLLSDTTKQVSKQYGVLNFLRLARRFTFVIDRSGVIQQVESGSEAIDPAGALRACERLGPL